MTGTDSEFKWPVESGMSREDTNAYADELYKLIQKRSMFGSEIQARISLPDIRVDQQLDPVLRMTEKRTEPKESPAGPIIKPALNPGGRSARVKRELDL